MCTWKSYYKQRSYFQYNFNMYFTLLRWNQKLPAILFVHYQYKSWNKVKTELHVIWGKSARSFDTFVFFSSSIKALSVFPTLHNKGWELIDSCLSREIGFLFIHPLLMCIGPNLLLFQLFSQPLFVFVSNQELNFSCSSYIFWAQNKKKPEKLNVIIVQLCSFACIVNWENILKK